MVDRTEADAGPNDQPTMPIRRPWHPPQFILVDIASTDVQGNGGNDGGPMGSAS
jgi:hypothetical protein